MIFDIFILLYEVGFHFQHVLVHIAAVYCSSTGRSAEQHGRIHVHICLYHAIALVRFTCIVCLCPMQNTRTVCLSLIYDQMYIMVCEGCQLNM